MQTTTSPHALSGSMMLASISEDCFGTRKHRLSDAMMCNGGESVRERVEEGGGAARPLFVRRGRRRRRVHGNRSSGNNRREREFGEWTLGSAFVEDAFAEKAGSRVVVSKREESGVADVFDRRGEDVSSERQFAARAEVLWDFPGMQVAAEVEPFECHERVAGVVDADASDVHGERAGGIVGSGHERNESVPQVLFDQVAVKNPASELKGRGEGMVRVSSGAPLVLEAPRRVLSGAAHFVEFL
mmetsp:Transcript_12253/g.36984  ORF Transcript_12253/g.36984 Transcript_12253/m.36984 type:complete len:243 (+) Transcript_12253:161-889(+)